MNAWFDELSRRLADAAEREFGVPISRVELDPVVAAELLELARVAAHTQERRFAPLASYLAGASAQAVATAGADPTPERIAGMIQAVRKELERAGSDAQPL